VLTRACLLPYRQTHVALVDYITSALLEWIISTTSGINPHSGYGSKPSGPLRISLQHGSWGSSLARTAKAATWNAGPQDFTSPEQKVPNKQFPAAALAVVRSPAML